MAYNIIRNILETNLITVTDLPSTIFWETVPYQPSNGVPHIRPVFIPTSTRPAVRGTNPQLKYQGLYKVFVYYPEGQGPQDLETCVNNILTTFQATTDLTHSGNELRIEYSDRGQVLPESPWIMVAVDIAWYYYS